MLVSCSVENSYLLFGFKQRTLIDNYGDENIEVQAIESTTVEPQIKDFGVGFRNYTLNDWEDICLDLKSAKDDITANILDIQFTDMEKLSVYSPGEVQPLGEIFVAIKDFNPEDREKPLESTGGVRVLGYRAGELILMTIPPNKGGWFEGYRFNDPERQCGLGHISSLKKLLFK